MLAVAVISRASFRDTAFNAPKLDLADAIAAAAQQAGARIVALPAGYLLSPTNAIPDAEALADDLARPFTERGLAVAAGIDLADATRSDAPALRPFYGFLATPADGRGPLWRQRSVRPRDIPASPSEQRACSAAPGLAVAFLHCGEVYSYEIREALRPFNYNAVLILGHVGTAKSFSWTLARTVDLSGCPVIACAQHHGSLRLWVRGAEYEQQQLSVAGITASLSFLRWTGPAPARP